MRRLAFLFVVLAALCSPVYDAGQPEDCAALLAAPVWTAPAAPCTAAAARPRLALAPSALSRPAQDPAPIRLLIHRFNE